MQMSACNSINTCKHFISKCRSPHATQTHPSVNFIHLYVVTMCMHRNGEEIYVKYYHRVKLVRVFVQGLFISFIPSQPYHYRHFLSLLCSYRCLHIHKAFEMHKTRAPVEMKQNGSLSGYPSRPLAPCPQYYNILIHLERRNNPTA
jgi:hypothetical protein